MGAQVEDQWLTLHGRPGGSFAIDARLHYGDQSIDETHTMSKSVFRELVIYREDDDDASFDTAYDDWFAGCASSAATVYQSGFRAACWKAM
jgi:hypothetical protein